MKYQDAWKIQEKYNKKPHGWIQFKGTDICMDVHCKCGNITHVDGYFCYSVKCGKCGQIYFVNGHVEFIEIDEPQGSCLVSE